MRDMANETSVSIIGAGHCGCAIAADVLGRGGKALLYAHPDHSAALHAILRQGYLGVSGKMRGRFMPVLSSDLGEALQFSDYLVLALPSFAHDDMIAALSAHDLARHVIVCIAGNFFCLAARRSLRAHAILETSSAPYASRVVGADVKVMGVKSQLHIASLAPIGDESTLQALARLFPMPLRWYRNVLEAGLSCINAVLHPVPALLNTGWIESTAGDFHFYRQGMSASVVRVMQAIDQERMSIASGYGLSVRSAVEMMNAYYRGRFASLRDFARESVEHNQEKMAPSSMRHRFVEQDVPLVLVPWHELGLKAGIDALTMRAIIQIASIVRSQPPPGEGSALRRLGLAGLDRRGILAAVAAG